MPLTVIGSGTLHPSPVRASASHLVETGVETVLLDVGPGSVHGMAKYDRPWWSVTHVVLTHFHTDHFGDLAHLLFALRWATPEGRVAPLHILGPPGLNDRIDGLVKAHGSFIRDQAFPIEYRELKREDSWRSSAGTRVDFHPTPHTEESVAVRLTTNRGVVGYTGDTGPAQGVGTFLSGVDLLVCECGFEDPAPADNHLSPESVATLASEAAPGLLILTHVYPPLRPGRAPALVQRAGYGGPVVAAEDGVTFRMPEDP
ncbi:MAG: MBL fold metallo-hydrolase [Longimicrobiales bacterium]